MRPIWYFVGLFLIPMGLLVLANGIYDLIVPPERAATLARLHPGIWWGAVILLVGISFYWFNRTKRVE